MKTVLQNDLFLFFLVVLICFVISFTYMFLKGIANRVNNINRRCKMLAAIFFELKSLNYPVLPQKGALLEAGINIDDLLYFGYTTKEIQAIYPEYQP